MREVFQAWQCIGCGRLDGPGQCVGICQDRPVRLVNAMDHEAALVRLAALERIVSRIAHTRPRNGEWERTWLALQDQAKQVLRDQSAGAQRAANMASATSANPAEPQESAT